MQDKYEKAVEYYNNKDYVNALKLFMNMNYLDSKSYENKCVDNLEDLIYYSSKKVGKRLVKELQFYTYPTYFEDAYKRKYLGLFSKILMFGAAGIGTIIYIIVLAMNK